MRIFVLAGEESGRIYAERIKNELKLALVGEEIVFRGYEDFGFKTADLAVMGFGPVLKRIGYFLGVAKTMKKAIAEERPAVVVTVDYPGMNLKLAAFAKSMGIPAVHLVCPQVWAWHQGRIPKVAAALSQLHCFFPFEPAIFNGTGLDAKFIGHPLVDVFTAEEKTRTSDPSLVRTVALLPGSRIGEIRRILSRLLAAADILHSENEFADVMFEVPAAHQRAAEEILAHIGNRNYIKVNMGGARELLRRANCAAVASGTATLEAALARCPTVLVYAVSPMLAAFARIVIKGVKHIGLANVIAEKSGIEPPMPEYLQEDFTAEKVANFLRTCLSNGEERNRLIAGLDKAMNLLVSDGDALGNSAREIVKLLSK